MAGKHSTNNELPPRCMVPQAAVPSELDELGLEFFDQHYEDFVCPVRDYVPSSNLRYNIIRHLLTQYAKVTVKDQHLYRNASKRCQLRRPHTRATGCKSLQDLAQPNMPSPSTTPPSIALTSSSITKAPSIASTSFSNLQASVPPTALRPRLV